MINMFFAIGINLLCSLIYVTGLDLINIVFVINGKHPTGSEMGFLSEV